MLEACQKSETSIDAESSTITIDGQSLNLGDVENAVERSKPVALTASEKTREAIASSRRMIEEAVKRGDVIYGVTTLFGGLANNTVNQNDAAQLQAHLISAHDASVGDYLAPADIKAAMLIRANTLARGASGVSAELIQRYLQFLTHNAIPKVRELGSIGASGDLVPLATVAAAVTGLNPRAKIDLAGKTVDASEVMAQLGIEPYRMGVKEGLALINGTSMMAGIAARNLYQFKPLFGYNVLLHSMSAQALMASRQSFADFVHEQKPHPGQQWVAKAFDTLLDGSACVSDHLDEENRLQSDELIQDRYSLRCLPQFLGPIVEGVQSFQRQLTVEMNSTTDNPLIDTVNGEILHGGNFLGQYLAMGMDQMRGYIALMAKHMDAQIALLMAPQFNRGLPASLVGDTQSGLNVGLKPLQIAGNSLVPMLEHGGNSIADRFPTHAEQFNQNINSQGMGACVLTRRSLELWQRYLAISSIVGVQAVDLRCYVMHGHYDGASILSSDTRVVYHSIKQLLLGDDAKDQSRPLVWDDTQQSLSDWVETLSLKLQEHDNVLFRSLPAALSFPDLA